MIVLLKVWIAYAIWGVFIYSLVFLWAVRSKQFTELDRQRYLALNAAEPVEDEDTAGSSPSRIDRYTWVGLMILTACVIGTVVLIGLYYVKKD